MANSQTNASYGQKKQPKLLLGKLFTDASVRPEPEEPQKILVAGLAEARPKKNYPDTFFGRAFSVFKGEFSTLFKGSLVFILFTVPFIVMMAWFAPFYENMVLGEVYNFLGDIGVGFPGGVDSLSESVARLIWDVKEPVFCLLAAAMIFASIGIGGLFYCAKRSYFQDYYKKSFRTYFMGFARYWWKYLLTAAVEVLLGLAIATSTLYLLKQQTLGVAGAGEYAACVLSWVIGGPLMLIPMVMQGMYTVYDLSIWKTFKNALVVIVNNPFSCIFTAIFSVAPLLLCLLGGFMSIIVYIVMALVGMTLMSLCWIALASRGMTKCHLRKEQEDKHSEQLRREEERRIARQNRGENKNKNKKAPVPYKNPKKKKKKQ